MASNWEIVLLNLIIRLSATGAQYNGFQLVNKLPNYVLNAYQLSPIRDAVSAAHCFAACQYQEDSVAVHFRKSDNQPTLCDCVVASLIDIEMDGYEDYNWDLYYLDDRTKPKDNVVFVMSQMAETFLYSPTSICTQSGARSSAQDNAMDAIVGYSDGWEVLFCGNVGGSSCSVYNVQSDTWGAEEPMPDSNFRNGFAVYQGNIYVATWNPAVYNPRTRSWSTWPRYTADPTDGSCMITWRDAFLLFGSMYHKGQFLMFNHTTQTWTQMPDMPIGRSFFGCALIPDDRNKVIMFGDFTGSGDCPNCYTSSIYDAATQSWNFPIGSTTYSRLGAKASIVDGKVLAIGGYLPGNSLISYDFVEQYNFNNNSWSVLPVRLKSPVFHAALLSGRVEQFPFYQNSCLGLV